MTRIVLSLVSLASTMLAAHAPYVFMAGNGSTVSVFDAHALSENLSIPYPGAVFSTVFSPDGTTAYVSTGQIFITDASTHRITGKLPSNNAIILRISPDGQHLFAGNSDNSVWVYDLASNTVTAKIAFRVHNAPVYNTADLQVSQDGSLIVHSTNRNQLRRRRMSAGRSPRLCQRDQWKHLYRRAPDSSYLGELGGHLSRLVLGICGYRIEHSEIRGL